MEYIVDWSSGIRFSAVSESTRHRSAHVPWLKIVLNGSTAKFAGAWLVKIDPFLSVFFHCSFGTFG